ncbi:MAG: rhodanese-like domain-containing protein [Thermoguttaceae bacterium]|jgi:rhodanese-related sulfurtransferase
MSIKTISVAELHELQAAGRPVELVDVRTPPEYREAHIEFARNVPLGDLQPVDVAGGREAGGGPVYLICRAGGRGKQACEKLLAAGLPNVLNVEGGTQAWIEAGLPVVRGKKAVSLERQVRIVAGSLVLAGVALGGLVHWAWYGLSAFVGAGLIFAGVTDRCGMALLLARLPWNRGPRPGQQPSCGCATAKDEVK